MEIKSRRFSRNDSDSVSCSSGSGKVNKNSLSLPRPLWLSLSQKQRKAFLAHIRAAQNGESISEERIKAILADNSGEDGDKKKKRKKIRTTKLCRSLSQENESSIEDVHTQIKSDDEIISSSHDVRKSNVAATFKSLHF